MLKRGVTGEAVATGRSHEIVVMELKTSGGGIANG